MTNSSRRGDEKAVIFLHIPKAAGLTLNMIAARQYPAAALFSIYEPEALDRFKALTDSQKRRIKFVYGHIPFGFHERLPQTTVYVTLLRDPIERVISHYYYVLRNPDHELYDLVTSQHLNLEDYVCQGLSTELDNGQTRQLAGVEGLGASSEIPYGQCQPELLEAAKNNLQQHFVVVGLTEKFDETLILLKRSLGWRKILYSEKGNVTANRPRREDIPTNAIKRIMDFNRLDIELYDFAKRLFEQQVGQQSHFGNDLMMLRLFNRLQVYRAFRILFARLGIK